MRYFFIIPLLSICLSLIVIFKLSLDREPVIINSSIVNAPLPDFSSMDLLHPNKNVTKVDLLGKPYLIHIWATWCSVCIDEHRVLLERQSQHPFELVGVLYSDHADQVLQWLSVNGNPYTKLLDDPKGSLIINMGAYGTPETYLIDKNGFVVERFIGHISDEDWNNKVILELDRDKNS